MRAVIKDVFDKTPELDKEDPEIKKAIPKGLMARAPEVAPLLDKKPIEEDK